MKLTAIFILSCLALCAGAYSETIEFLHVPWNSTPAEAKRVMTTPEGTKVKEDSPDRIVLTGGTFETHAVERWELEFPDGHFRRGTVYVVIPYGKSNDGSLLRNKQYDDYLKRLTDKYGKGTGFGDGKHSQTTWELTVADPRNGQKDMVSILLSYSWEPYVFKIEYSRHAQTSAPPAPAAAAQPVAAASTPAPNPASAPGSLIRADGGGDLLKLLGPLANNLTMALSMDGAANGSVVFSRLPITAKFSAAVEFGLSDGRQSAVFGRGDAVLRFTPPMQIGKVYTLATWIKLPTPRHVGVVWQCEDYNCPLSVFWGTFACWKNSNHSFCPASVVGWHHVAVASDGNRLAFYLDGKEMGAQTVLVDAAVSTVGNHFRDDLAKDDYVDRLDDMFVFNRELTPTEIAQVMRIRLPINPSAAGVVGANSQPLAAVATPEAAAANPVASNPVSRDLVKTYRNSLVFVTGADGSGSGFVATLGGASFLFTNAHVAAGIKGAGFKSLDGTKVTGGAPTIAVGHDIFRMQLPAGGTPFEVMLGVDEKVTIDDEVVVLGNAEGAGVINTIKGKVVGVGPQLVEVDAPFQPGNSGSPIIHLKTGKVIGVATYLTIKKYDAATKEVLKTPVVRRFGYRLDSVKTWQPVQWPAFYAQAAEMQAIETLTGDLDSFLVDLSQHHGKITSGAHSNPAIKTRIDQWLADKKKHLNPKDAASVDQNFISFLKVASRADVAAARQRMTYEYFMRGLTGVEQDRSAIIEIFDKIIRELQKER